MTDKDTVQAKFFKPASLPVQRKCSHCEEEENKKVQRKEMNQETMHADKDFESYVGNLGTSGQPLPNETRNFYEARFGCDFSKVKVHTDTVAAKSAQSINALAYTSGNHIIFKQGQYSPGTEGGKKLLAHELTHVAQQAKGMKTASIQRDCSDPDFCTPYPTAAEAASAELRLRSYYLPADEMKFGADSRVLFESYLNRSPGDSLSPVIFNNPTNNLVDSFASSRNTADDQDAVIDLVGSRLSRVPGGPLQDFTPTMMSLANFLSAAEMNDRPINYSNPFSIAGHVAGGIGSSDAGPDYRKITYGNVTLEKTPLIGSTGYVTVETTLQYEVFDAVDFCPGDCGAGFEQYITIPMSRLEAGGQAYDVPFKVNFTAPSRSKRFWY
ncbi:DUF4157 domain-containing protein [Paraflavitalea speifideaquila]|uniref:eCIS core domain-containing protein n=1 Tax=Paraflavitalea speifideaquila TaxID=3076558 RepID=UPI0028EC9088|nr:DUF4157 domain-containing protein [Paraflavitalea speifideiaquila]